MTSCASPFIFAGESENRLEASEGQALEQKFYFLGQHRDAGRRLLPKNLWPPMPRQILPAWR